MALRRVSAWQIIWAPATAGARTLLSAGDDMAEELSTSESGASSTGALDGVGAALVVARGGSKRRLEMSRVRTHSSFNTAWKRLCQEMASDMWGETATLQITPTGEAARVVRAALLSTSHTLTTETGCIETIHRWRFRVSRDTI